MQGQRHLLDIQGLGLRTQNSLGQWLAIKGIKIDQTIQNNQLLLAKIYQDLNINEMIFEFKQMIPIWEKMEIQEQNIKKGYLDLKIAHIIDREIVDRLINEALTSYLREQRIKKHRIAVKEYLYEKSRQIHSEQLYLQMQEQTTLLAQQLLDEMAKIDNQTLDSLFSINKKITDLSEKVQQIKVERDQSLNFYASILSNQFSHYKINGEPIFESDKQREDFFKKYLYKRNEIKQRMSDLEDKEALIDAEITVLEHENIDLKLKAIDDGVLDEETLEAGRMKEAELIFAIDRKIDVMNIRRKKASGQSLDDMEKETLAEMKKEEKLESKRSKINTMAKKFKGKLMEKVERRAQTLAKIDKKIKALEKEKELAQLRNEENKKEAINDILSSSSNPLSLFTLSFRAKRLMSKDKDIKNKELKLQALKQEKEKIQAEKILLSEQLFELPQTVAVLCEVRPLMNASKEELQKFNEEVEPNADLSFEQDKNLVKLDKEYQSQIAQLQSCAKTLFKNANEEKEEYQQCLGQLNKGTYTPTTDQQQREVEIEKIYHQIEKAHPEQPTHHFSHHGPA